MRPLLIILLTCAWVTAVSALPSGFVYLHQVSPDIIEELRYASADNFTGQRVPGYQAGRCILTQEAARQLALVEQTALKNGYKLKVYDCYRPRRAVKAFYRWSQSNDIRTKPYYYPREAKTALFAKGYISLASGHSRGSTVDLSLVKLTERGHYPKKASAACYSQTNRHINDDSINTGTRFDCLDQSAHVFYPDLTASQRRNRLLLRQWMMAQGFSPYSKEWWHFTLKQEPYPRTYFDFPVH